ncbi:MAG: AmmeMemoRadiSam system protein B [Candidatus Micrarchaeota archaeon]|nr:AmmeMemoRadiSam system protein B [Candidatus Micrarchaeota archaeon]
MTDTLTRKPYVAGYFYPKERNTLQEFVLKSIKDNKALKPSRIVVSPHAGYIYSGNCAGFSFSSLQSYLKDDSTVILVGPNHTGFGHAISISSVNWETPLGVLRSDKQFINELVKKNNWLKLDEFAHVYEHSLEVMLPFLQAINPNIKIVCICMLDQSQETSTLLAKAIYQTIKDMDLKNNFCVVCSSDFTHYESALSAKQKDMQCIDAILNLDTAKFHHILNKLNASICGYGPITVGMELANFFEFKNAVLNQYTNSGEKTKDYSEVVAYASISF